MPRDITRVFRNLLIVGQLFLLAILLGACSSSSDSNGAQSNATGQDQSPAETTGNRTKIPLTLSGDQTVPAVTGGGSGTGSLEVDEQSGEISGSISVTGLTGAPTAVHIHMGSAGETGGIVIGLEKDPDDANLWRVLAGSALAADQLAALLAAKTYINVHTAANPAGEIRGQILPPGFKLLSASLSGENEIPPVTTTASGKGFVTVETGDERDILVTLRTTGLDDATAAHIHAGFAGANGGIVLGLKKDANDPALWRAPDGSRLEQARLDALLAGGAYFNVHGPAHPSGEIRGQIVAAPVRVVRSELSGAQEVPPVTTTGTGIGYVTVDGDSGAITANLLVADLSAAATAAHIHTSTHPGGEIRGQITP